MPESALLVSQAVRVWVLGVLGGLVGTSSCMSHLTNSRILRRSKHLKWYRLGRTPSHPIYIRLEHLEYLHLRLDNPKGCILKRRPSLGTRKSQGWRGCLTAQPTATPKNLKHVESSKGYFNTSSSIISSTTSFTSKRNISSSIKYPTTFISRCCR